MQITINKDTNHDFIKIAELHKKGISSGFLSSFTTKTLGAIYQTIAENKGSVLISAAADNRTIGFVSATLSLGCVYKDFIKKLKLNIIFEIVFPLKNLFKIIELIIYPSKNSEKVSAEAELLSIVVAEEYRGKGIAELLYKELLKEFKKRNINSFKIIVGENLSKAISFYKRMGAVIVDKIELHKGLKSLVFLHTVNERRL